MTLRVSTPPTGSIVTLADAKTQLGIAASDVSQDALLIALLDVATVMVEGETQRLYRAQSIDWVRDDWVEEMRLPLAAGGGPQNLVIDSVKYFDTAFTQQTLSPTLYWSRPVGETLAIVQRWFAVWPWLGDGAERVVISFSVKPQVIVPPEIRYAALMTLVNLYRMAERSPHVTREQTDMVGLTNYQVTAAAQAVYDATVQSLLSKQRWH